MSGMGAHQSHRMVSDVWLTPPEIIDALGPFDLDPCAAPCPRPWPTALQHIALPENGLMARWHGFVWCNPPYGRETDRWLARLDEHGNGLALIFARTETASFFRRVWRAQNFSGALFLEGRLHFHRANGDRAALNAGAPSVLIAYGAEAAARLSRSNLPGAFISQCAIIGGGK
jgi:hypothetical protein